MIISGTNVGNMLVSFKDASPTSFWENKTRNLELNMSQYQHARAICCWLEVADDVISARDVETFRHCRGVILELLALEVLWKIECSYSCSVKTTVGPFWPHFRNQRAKISNDLGLHKWKRSTRTNLSKTVIRFEIGCTVIETFQPEYDPKWTHS